MCHVAREFRLRHYQQTRDNGLANLDFSDVKKCFSIYNGIETKSIIKLFFILIELN